MAISDDWDFNFSDKVISHIDGYLKYDGGSGTAPVVGDMVIGNTSGAIGKVLQIDGGLPAGGLTLTNTVGLFQDDETLDILSYVDFYGVGNGGFAVGDTIVDQVSGSIDVKFIEYNIGTSEGGSTAGFGRMYGNNMSLFTHYSPLDISGGTSSVAIAYGIGEDKDGYLTADVNETLEVPGTPNTNNCIILHYENGTIAIPEDARISDGYDAEGFAQAVFGSTVIGSIRVIDSDTTAGVWDDGYELTIEDVVFYDNLVAGKVFSAGDVVKGDTSGAKGRVLSVITDSGTTGKLILANKSGTWDHTTPDNIQVLQADDTYLSYAEVANNTFTLYAADINIPNGVRDTQREDQGGIYGPGSLNIVRSANALYSYAMDLFDELAQLDDDPAFEGNVRDQLYTVLNNYVIPDLSFRFLEKGSFKDTGNNNIFTNIQTTGAIADIRDNAYFYNTTNPTPQPDMYVEQDGVVVRQDWLEGNLNILLKTKTSTDPKYIDPAVEALGQVIDGGAFTVHVRPYRRTYDSNEVTQIGGIAVVALGNAVDLNNTTGQYSVSFTSGVGTPFTVGEEATTTDGKRIVIVTSDTGASGDVTYVLKSDTNLVNTDVFTGVVSGAYATASTPTTLVAGYDEDIRVMVVQRRFTGGTTSSGPFVYGEWIQQLASGADGYFMEDDSGTIYIEESNGTFTGTDTLTGYISGATNTPTATAAYSTVPKDIGGGVGDKNYTAVVSADVTDADPQTVANVYEWWKFITRKEASNYQVKTAGGLYTAYTPGNIYRRLQSTFAEVRGASPFGVKAGALVIGAQGVFIQKETLDPNDIRSIQLTDNLGNVYDPPNLQALVVTNITSGVRVAVYRSTGVGNEDILRTEFAVGSVGTHNQSSDSTVLVKANTRSVSPLPSDIPDEGVLRVLDPSDTGNYLRFPYSSVDRTTNVFTLTAGTIGDVTGGVDLVEDDNVHVVLIEEESTGTSVSNTIQYVANIPLFVRARIKGKVPFKTTSTFTTIGASVGAVLNPDTVVNLP